MSSPSGLRYGLDERPPLVVTVLGSLQWLGFVIAANVMVPLVLGDAFGFTPAEVTALAQRMLLTIGLGSLWQLWRGHGLPASEGVSYVWLGVFLALAGVARGAGRDPQTLLPALEGGLIAAGLVLLVFAFSGLAGRLQRLFTPVVVAAYLILLPIQFSGPFLRSMLGVGSVAGALDWRIAGVSLLAVATTLGFSFGARSWLRSISSLLGLVAGVIGWLALGLPAAGSLTRTVNPTPTGSLTAPALGFLFAWGMPRWELGVAVTAILTEFLLLSNVIATIATVAQVTEREADEGSFRRATAVKGADTILTGVLSSVGLVPVATSAGFISLTGLASRRPFVVSCFLLLAVAFSAPVVRVLTLLPLPLAYAVTFAAFNEMLGLAIQRLRQAPLTRGSLATLSLSVFIGTGLMFLPPAALAGLHPILQNLLGNGLLTGALLSLLFEHLVFRRLDTPI